MISKAINITRRTISSYIANSSSYSYNNKETQSLAEQIETNLANDGGLGRYLNNIYVIKELMRSGQRTMLEDPKTCYQFLVGLVDSSSMLVYDPDIINLLHDNTVPLSYWLGVLNYEDTRNEIIRHAFQSITDALDPEEIFTSILSDITAELLYPSEVWMTVLGGSESEEVEDMCNGYLDTVEFKKEHVRWLLEKYIGWLSVDDYSDCQTSLVSIWDSALTYSISLVCTEEIHSSQEVKDSMFQNIHHSLWTFTSGIEDIYNVTVNTDDIANKITEDIYELIINSCIQCIWDNIDDYCRSYNNVTSLLCDRILRTYMLKTLSY